MIGLVLSGGRSMRMGSDKGLLLKDGKAWAEIAWEKLGSVLPKVKISVNADQYLNYCNVFEKKALIQDSDELSVKGPLRGILSAHIKHPEEDQFVLACDLVLMEFALIEEVVNSYLQQPGYEAYVFTHHEDVEPLCGIFTSNGLQRIHERYQKDPDLKNSMKYVLSQLNICQIPLAENDIKCFTNFNDQQTRNDL